MSLSIDNIAKIFSGQLTDWSQVGLPPGKINVYSASQQSGTFSTFNALVLQPRNLALAPSAQLLLVQRRGFGRGCGRPERHRPCVLRLPAQRQGA